ncbi:helix-turn-helix domain-containing protein [Thauera sp.]|uniref:helix-turn-helix domain-containing protein n=1 Tax=Thauera sp. TaxID=1905334 RepID=UPI0039E5E042
MAQQTKPSDTRCPSSAGATHLAGNLRRMRRDAKLTSDQLAELSGVSRAMISKIERGVSVPTATVLGKLAAALEVSLSQLLGSPRPRTPRLTKLNEQAVFRDPETGFERRSISPVLEDGGVDLAFNVLPAKRSVRFPAHHGGVEEHLYVHEGTLTVILDETPFVVSAGDTLFFPSDCIHEFRNETDEPTRFLIVIDDRSKR